MTDYPVWSLSGAEQAAAERAPLPDLLPGENFYAVTDPEDEWAAMGEEREYRHTRYGGDCD